MSAGGSDRAGTALAVPLFNQGLVRNMPVHSIWILVPCQKEVTRRYDISIYL